MEGGARVQNKTTSVNQTLVASNSHGGDNSMELIPNLSNEPHRFIPVSSATSPQSDPELAAMLDKLEALFVSPHLRRRLETPDVHTQCREITGRVAAALHVDVTLIHSSQRCQHVTFCRQMCMFLCRKLTAGSWPVLGRHFDRNHATVIHAYQLIKRRMEREAGFRRFVEQLEARITETMSATAEQVVA